MVLTATQTITNDFNDILFDSTSATNQALIAQYAGQLASGAISAPTVAANIAALPEANIVDYVYSLYSSVLNYSLSSTAVGGLKYWVQQVESLFLTPADIAAGTMTDAAVVFLDQSFINAAGTGGTPAFVVPTGPLTVANVSPLVQQMYEQAALASNLTEAQMAGGVTYWATQYIAEYNANGAAYANQFLVNSFANAANIPNATIIHNWLGAGGCPGRC